MKQELYEKFQQEVGPHADGVLDYIKWLENRVMGYRAHEADVLAENDAMSFVLNNIRADHAKDAQLWQDLLRDTMRNISEEYYCAGWRHNLEYYLWEILADDVSEENKDALLGSFDPKDLSKLRRLVGLAGGWFYCNEVGEQFILTHDWTPLYLAWKEKRNAEV